MASSRWGLANPLHSQPSMGTSTGETETAGAKRACRWTCDTPPDPQLTHRETCQSEDLLALHRGQGAAGHVHTPICSKLYLRSKMRL